MRPGALAIVGVALAVVAVGCAGHAAPPATAAVPIGVPKGAVVAVEREDFEASRRQVLAAFDAGDLASAAAELATWKTPSAASLASIVRGFEAHAPARRPRLLANVTPHRVSALPESAARNAREGKLVAIRAPAPQGVQDAHLARDGRLFSESPSSSEALPSWLPPRLGELPLRRLRAADGRWIAMWGGRYVAVIGGATPELLDFGGWTEASPAERREIEWADVVGDVLYVTTRRPMGDRAIVAIITATGKPLWRSEEGYFAASFVVADRTIVAWKHGAARGAPGELVTLRRETGVTSARRATPEVDSGECLLSPVGGIVSCVASSTLSGGKGLRSDESLEIRESAPLVAAPPPEPASEGAPAIARLAPPPAPDARIDAWRLLDAADPRAAVLGLRALLGARPTDVAALALDEIARASLEAARTRAASEIVTHRPSVAASDTPTGNAPVHRPHTRRLVVESSKTITPDLMVAEFPAPTDDDLLAPAWVPEKLGPRGRNADAGAVVSPSRRVEVYWGYGSPSLTVSFRDARVISVFEHQPEVRASGVVDDVLLTIAGHGTFFLEAHDEATGALYYRTKEELHDQYFVVEQGYVVASTTAKPTADIVLIEADTGKIASRIHLPPPQDPFLVFRRAGAIVAVNMRSAVVVSLK